MLKAVHERLSSLGTLLLVGLVAATTTPRAIIKNPTQIPNLDQKVDYERIYEQHSLGHFYTASLEPGE